MKSNVIFCFFLFQFCNYSSFSLKGISEMCTNKLTEVFRVCRCGDVQHIYTLINAHICAGFCVWLLPSATDNVTKLHFLNILIGAWINTQIKPTKESSLGQYWNLSLLLEWFLWGNCSSLKMPLFLASQVFSCWKWKMCASWSDILLWVNKYTSTPILVFFSNFESKWNQTWDKSYKI